MDVTISIVRVLVAMDGFLQRLAQPPEADGDEHEAHEPFAPR